MLNLRNLKPCPTCGSSWIVSQDNGRDGMTFEAWIMCPECKTSTARYEYESDAIKAWNDGEVEEFIKRCPCCGGAAEFKGKKRIHIACKVCGLRTASFKLPWDNRDGLNLAMKTASDVWNKRSG